LYFACSAYKLLAYKILDEYIKKYIKRQVFGANGLMLKDLNNIYLAIMAKNMHNYNKKIQS